MNRRNFLQQSSLAMLAVSGLPKGIRFNQTSGTIYKTELKPGVSGQTFYALKINHEALQNFSLATDDSKAAGLQVKFYSGTDFTSPAQSSDFTYTLTEAKLTDPSLGIYTAKAKPSGKTGDYKLPDDYQKTIVLEVKLNSYANILSKNGKSQLVHIPYPVSTTSTGTGDCFLTTACVDNQGLPDTCDELQTLRLLRDNYMTASNEGQNLIASYKKIGPQLVMAINNYENKEAIYSHMYQHMILPAVTLVKENKEAEAVAYYQLFVQALHKNYCQD